STFHPVQQSADVRYDRFGVSGSVLIGLAPGPSLAGWARSDTRLRAKVADTTSAVTDLPLTAGGGPITVPSPSARFAAAAAGPCVRRPGARAAGASGRRAHRARLDCARGAHRAAVNVYFHTFGCKANQYDTALVRQAFADQGAVVVDDPAAADVAVVNSCTV